MAQLCINKKRLIRYSYFCWLALHKLFVNINGIHTVAIAGDFLHLEVKIDKCCFSSSAGLFYFLFLISLCSLEQATDVFHL